MADPGSFEYWQAGEQPVAAPEFLDSGTLEFWQAGEQPPVLQQSGEEERTPDIVRAPIPSWCH